MRRDTSMTRKTRFKGTVQHGTERNKNDSSKAGAEMDL